MKKMIRSGMRLTRLLGAALLLLAAGGGRAVHAEGGLGPKPEPHALPHPGTLDQFPAGKPKLNSPYFPKTKNWPQWHEPELQPNQYRGLYGHTTCTADALIRPESTVQLAAAVKDVRARAAREGRPLKMRAARDGFATMNSLPCSAQPSAPGALEVDGKAPLQAAILMDRMTQVLGVDADALQLRVQAQMTLKQLYAAADAHGLSIPRSSLPWWQGLTLAGVFATGSHGTGDNTTSMICDWFVDVTWVDAEGEVHISPKGSDEATALCGGIGLLGAITELTLQMTPTSTTFFDTHYLKDDKQLAADIEELLKITPHVVVMWRPDVGKYTAHLQKPAPEGAKPIPGARCNVIPQQTHAAATFTGPLLREWQSDPFNKGSMYYSIGFDASACLAALTSAVGATWVTKASPSDALGLPIPLFKGVALTNHITSTDCGDRCVFTNKKFMANALDVEFAMEHEHLASWIADIRAVIKHDLRGIPGWGDKLRCLLPGYFVMRFGRSPQSLIGNAAGLKRPVYLQQQMLASKATPGLPSRYEWVQETYEQLTLCKYDGRPHTGKNWDRTFTNPRCPLAKKFGDNWQKMAALQDKWDPQRAWQPALWSRVVAGEGYRSRPRCAVDRSCFCSVDEHCAEGFACRPSLAFPEFRTCQPAVMN